ncbi:hypothetical protein H1R20_g12695, partial [Candolleomyces eurysporus]
MSSSLLQHFKSTVIVKIRGVTMQNDARNQYPQIARQHQSQDGPELETHFPLNINRIDDDVLISIFLTALEAADSANPPMSPAHPAVVFTHVCRRWREAALSARVLWQKIHLVIPEYPRGWLDPNHHELCAWKLRLLKQQQMTETWISRTGESQLHIMVSEAWTFPPTHRSCYGEQDYSNLTDLINVLCETSSRWKELELDLTFVSSQRSSFPTTRFLSLPPQDDPLLTKVRLDINWNQPDESLSHLLVSKPSILEAVSLRSLTVSNETMVHHDLMALSITWSALTHLDFRGYPSTSNRVFNQSQALEILRLCPNLVSCYLALASDSKLPPSPGNPITLRFLEEITLRPCKWHIARGFAPSLTLPSLRKFSVQSVTGSLCSPLPYAHSGLCEFIERFGHSLRDVTFQYITLTRDALRQCLANLPNVLSLTLTDAPWAVTSGDCARIDAKLLQSLSPQFDPVGFHRPGCPQLREHPLCPMMEELTLTINVSVELEEMALVDFIESRRKMRLMGIDEGRTVTCLKAVTCNGHWARSLNVIEELRRRGVDIDGFSLESW